MPQVNLDGFNTYYETKGEGEPLILIHGLGSSARDWEYQLDEFARHFRVIPYDVRGHGQSGKPKGPYSIPMFAQDLADLLKALEIPSAHILGISMGGWIAFQFAVDHPEMVKSLVIVNSWADMRPKNFGERWNLFQRVVLFQLFSMRKIGEILSQRLFIKPEQEELRQTFVSRWSENYKPSYMASMRAGVGWSVAHKLGEITVPTLFVAADEDYSPLESKQFCVDQMPDARLVVIEDSRHATPVEKPEEFNNAVLGFLLEL